MSDDVKAPLKQGSIRIVGILWSIISLGLGIVAVREALAASDVIDGSNWLADLAREFDGLEKGSWLLAVAIATGIVALALFTVVFKPRRRIGLALRGASAVFLTPSAAAGIALASTRRIDGVISASAKASKSKLDLSAKTTTTSAELETQIRSVVDHRLSALESKPNIKIRMRQQRVDA